MLAQSEKAVRDPGLLNSTCPPPTLINNPILISGTTSTLNIYASSTHNECTPNVASEAQTTSHTASVSTAQDQISHDDGPSAVVVNDNSAAASTQIIKSDAVPMSCGKTKAKASESGGTSGTKRPRGLSAHTTGQSGMRKRVHSGLADQDPVPPMNDKSLQNSEAPNTCTMAPMLPTKLDFLLWKLTPFALEPVGDNLYCPRLVVDLNTPLSRVLPPASYPLDSAILLIHRYRSMGKSMPCEATSVLTVYDQLHRLDFSIINITLLDPLLYNSSDHSAMQKKAFHKQLGGWIDLLSHSIEIPCVGTCRLETIRVDYAQLRLSLSLSKRSSSWIWEHDWRSYAPPRREIPWQGYGDIYIDSPILPQMSFARGTLEDVIFCLCWMSNECNSEDIHTVITWRRNDCRLKPHHIDLIGGQIFQDPLYEEGTDIIRAFKDLSEEEKQRRKEDFWKDLEMARQEEMKLAQQFQILRF